MVFDMNSAVNARNLAESPLITVTGELEDLILDKFAKQFKNDLGEKSVDFKRPEGGLFQVYLEANFVPLDESCHWLSDLVLKKFQQKTRLNNLAHYSSSSTAIDRRNLSGQSFSIPSSNQYPSIPYHRVNTFTSLSNSTSSVRRNHSFNAVRKNNSFTNKSKNSPTSSEPTASYDSSNSSSNVNHQLIEFLGQRVAKTNGAPVLLNTFWLKASHDLKSYNNNVRSSLMEWFSKLLLNISSNITIGVSGKFSLDCAIVIVLSKDSISTRDDSLKSNYETPKQSSAKKSFFKNGLSFSSSNKFSKASSNLGSSISSGLFGGSLSSLNVSNSSTPNSTSSFSLLQLVETIYNDLKVGYELFYQKHISSGNVDSKIISTLNIITQQLSERIVIFDGNFDGTTSKNYYNSTSNITHNSTPTSGKVFSLGDSIKISTNSLMSPSKSSSKKANTNGSSDLFAFTPVNYDELVQKFCNFLRDSYVDILDTFELNVRKQREMQNQPDWDFFEFFLLQEELSLIYENLGVYDKALVQYDELDALFSQSILNTNAAGGVGPKWIYKRLVCDSQKEDLDGPYRDSIVNDSYVSLYSSWNGLCLCNPERTISIRHKLVNAVRRDSIDLGCDLHDNGEVDSAFESSITTTISSNSIQSRSSPNRLTRKISQNDNDSIVNFVDPLGANSNGRGSLTSFSNRNTYSEQISLIDFRNYLFARQCHLLCMRNEPWYLARRALPFLQSCVSEINLLEISIAPGGIACWVFCSVLEIIHKCEMYSDSSQLESYSYYTVGLWSYARDKLAELGRLCHLMPGCEIEPKNISDHLHRMVELTAGMGADPHLKFGSVGTDDNPELSPQERLKDALSSADNFLKTYLEITELTMGTYKHIGYIRSARLIGKELSQLYLKLNKPQQALPFLLDLYNMFQIEKWINLKIEASKLMAECLEALYYSAFTDQSNVNTLDSNSTGFNLEATVRSAFRTFLLHLVKLNTNTNESSLEHEFYFNKICSLLRHYQESGIALSQIGEKLFDKEYFINFIDSNKPLLAIHNINSDLFYDDYNSTSNISTHSCGSSNQNSTQKCAKTKGSFDKHKTAISRASYSNYQRDHFYKVKSINIICDDFSDSQTHGSSRKVSKATLRPDQNSFLAGSLLTMHIQIHSELTFDLELENLQITMQTSNSIQNFDLSNSSSSLDAIDQSYYYGDEKIIAHTQMETYLNSHEQAAVKCLNTEHILNHSKKTNFGGNLKFLPQLPVSLLNQRLSDDEYNFRHYRFLGSSHHFDLVKSDKVLLLKPGTNEYCLQFKTIDNFNCNEQDNGNDKQNSKQLWFKMDQIVLFLNFPDKLSSAIVDDFDDMILPSATTFRLVKCPPTIELIPYDNLRNEDKSQHTTLFTGLDHLICLRIKSGTNILPKGLKFRIEIIPHSENSDLNMKEISFDYDLVGVTLHKTTIDSNNVYSVEDEKLDCFCLEQQMEPFESLDIFFTLRSDHIKPQICYVNQADIPEQIDPSTNTNPVNAINSANLNNSYMFSKVFVLKFYYDSPDMENDIEPCHFILKSPYLLNTKLHTVIGRKIIEICLRGPSELGSRILEVETPTLEPSPNSNETIFQPIKHSKTNSSIKLRSNSEIKFLSEILSQNSEAFNHFVLNLQYKEFNDGAAT